MAKHISIIVVNWNNASDTIACIASLHDVQYSAFDIIVVDNGSQDGSADKIQAAAEDITLIRNERNLGFAVGNNIGIQCALKNGADAVLLLNNDTTVDPEILTAFVSAQETHPEAGFLTAKIYYFDDPNRIWMGQPRWNKSLCAFEHDGLDALDDRSRFDSIAEVSYACGCALFATADTLTRVGLMEPKFFCYFEEADWCFRAAREGLKSYFVPGAKVWHKVSATSGGKQAPIVRYFRTRNRLLFAQRNLLGRECSTFMRRVRSEAFREMGWREKGLIATLQRAYWNLRSLSTDPQRSAWARGVRDFRFRRFGDAPDKIKRLR
jgi:GT2 family glycosyltransferase